MLLHTGFWSQVNVHMTQDNKMSYNKEAHRSFTCDPYPSAIRDTVLSTLTGDCQNLVSSQILSFVLHKQINYPPSFIL